MIQMHVLKRMFDYALRKVAERRRDGTYTDAQARALAKTIKTIMKKTLRAPNVIPPNKLQPIVHELKKLDLLSPEAPALFDKTFAHYIYRHVKDVDRPAIKGLIQAAKKAGVPVR